MAIICYAKDVTAQITSLKTALTPGRKEEEKAAVLNPQDLWASHTSKQDKTTPTMPQAVAKVAVEGISLKLLPHTPHHGKTVILSSRLLETSLQAFSKRKPTQNHHNHILSPPMSQEITSWKENTFGRCLEWL